MKSHTIRKPILPLLAGAAAVAAAVSFWPSSAPAQEAEAATGTPPIGRLCVVSLDPGSEASEARRVVQPPKSKLGYDYDLSSEGTLVRVDADWVVLKDGNFENWIPRDKVLLIRVAR